MRVQSSPRTETRSTAARARAGSRRDLAVIGDGGGEITGQYSNPLPADPASRAVHFRLHFRRPMRISVVVPVYNEQGNLPELLPRLAAVMDAPGQPYELVFVDDGSSDGSLALLKDAARRRPDRIRVLELARNFGQHQAILAAFQNVTGDVVVTLDAD